MLLGDKSSLAVVEAIGEVRHSTIITGRSIPPD